MMYYIIKVIENHETKYLFNTRVLLGDMELAKRFSSLVLATRYLKKVKGVTSHHCVIPVKEHEPTIDCRTIGGIVE